MKILLIEDENISRITLENILQKEGYDIFSVENGKEGLNHFLENKIDVVITDLRLPYISGMELLKAIKEKNPDCFVIVITAYATIDTAVEAMKLGAYDYLTKPFSPDRVLSMLKHIKRLKDALEENVKLKTKLKNIEEKPIIGVSSQIKQLIETIKTIAKHDYTVLIEGESGTGKEIVARALHSYSNRKDFPFIAFNCSAIPESLLESELFVHEKGFFTGAIKRHIGYFERAHGGTLFIDDIDDLPLTLQVKLLRVLQEREIVRIGGDEIVQVNVRVICATKVDLYNLVKTNRFREDLYYRLNIIPIKLPPLRERKEDIIPLFIHFLQQRNAQDKIKHLTNELQHQLIHYNWPGNVRELENVTERFIILSETGSINNLLLPNANISSVINHNFTDQFKNIINFNDYIKQKEKEILEWALKTTNYNITAAAQLLKLPRSTLRSKLKGFIKNINFDKVSKFNSNS